jgi:hypothetical protein
VLRIGRAGGGRATGIISIWFGWERLTLKRHRLQPATPGGLLLYRIDRRRGPERRLADGALVRRGDSIVELHLDNRRLVAMRSEAGYSTWKAVHVLRADLAALGSRIASGVLGPVVALHGVSLLGAAGGLLGFESHELPHTWRTAFDRYFLAGIDAVYHPAGLDRLAGRQLERWPAEVWMSSARAVELSRRR